MSPMRRRAALSLTGLALSLYTGLAVAEVVAVVSVKNPLTMVNKSQIVEIFLGKTSRFPNGSQALPIDQPEGSAERNEFYARFAGKSAAQIKAHWSKIIFTGRGQPPNEAANSAEVKRRIIDNPNAIGYIERNLVDDKVRVLLAQ